MALPWSCALEWVWRRVLMKADGKTANPRLDWIGSERFGEASGRSFGHFEEEDQV